MEREKIKILNYVLFVTFTIYLIISNIKAFPIAKEMWLESSLIGNIIATIVSGIIAIVGIFLIYYSLLKMKKIIYQIFLIFSILALVFFFIKTKTYLDYVMLIVAVLPTIICSYLILKYHKFLKK